MADCSIQLVHGQRSCGHHSLSSFMGIYLYCVLFFLLLEINLILIWFDIRFQFRNSCAIRRKLFPTIRFDLLLYYYSITHWPLTLKTLSVMPTHVMSICVTFYSNRSTTWLAYRDIASRVNGQRTDGQRKAGRSTPKSDVLCLLLLAEA